MPVSSYSFLLGPLVATAALGLIVLICRWVFSTGPRDQRAARRAATASDSGDYGLLVPVATALSSDAAGQARGLLHAAGLRATVAPGAEPDSVVLLVFRRDAGRAREVLRSPSSRGPHEGR